MANTNTSTSSTKVSPKAQAFSFSEAKKDNFRRITQNLIQTHPNVYGLLGDINNIDEIILATISLESSGNMLFTKNFTEQPGGQKGESNTTFNGTSSCHPNPLSTSESSSIRTYWKSDVVRTAIDSNNVNNIKAANEGRVAHGLGGIMGYYFVKGFSTHDEFFGKLNHKEILTAYGLEVDINAGERVSIKLFPDDSDLSITKNIAVMLCLYNEKLRVGKSTYRDNKSAIDFMIGNYLGGNVFKLPSSSETAQRVAKVNSLVGNPSTINYSTSSTAYQNRVAGTSSTTSDSQSPPGCA